MTGKGGEMAEITLNDGNFEEEVLKAKDLVFVDFWAPWCMPCKMMAPVVENLAREYEGKAKICKLNVEEGQKTAATYGIRSIPTVIIFKDGKQVDQSVGVLPEEGFKKKIDALL
jgi:thioredoxin 1